MRIFLAVAGIETVTEASTSDSTSSKTVTALCPAGKVVLGGGSSLTSTNGNLAVHASYPSAAGAWTVVAVETDNVGASWSVTAYAICATGS